MQMLRKTQLLALPLLVGWWTACTTSKRPDVASEPVPKNDAPADAALGNNAAEDFEEEDAATMDDAEASDFANGATSGDFAADTSGAEDDLFAEALAEEAKEKPQAAPAPAAPPTPAAGAKAGEADSTAALTENAAAPDLEPHAGASQDLNAGSAPVNPMLNAQQQGSPLEDIAANVVPIGEGSDLVPPPIQQGTAAPASAAAAPAAAAPQAPIVAQTVEELEAALSSIRWIGYRINEEGRQLRIEILTDGRPEFEVYEERNRAQQLELVIRFYQSKLRHKIRRPINSSEFRSPVAYVRMREYPERGIVDVVLTHRDKILPQFYTSPGKLLFVYGIPQRYFDKSKPLSRSVKDRAESLVKNDERPLFRQVASPEGVRHVGFQGPEPSQREIEAARPIREYMQRQARQRIDSRGLPESFERGRSTAAPLARTGWRWKRASLMAVAQDNLESEDGSASDEGEASNASQEVSPNEAGNEGNTAQASEGDQGDGGEEAIPVETVTEGADGEFEEGGPLSNSNAARGNAAANAANAAVPQNAATASGSNAAPVRNPKQAPGDAAVEPPLNNAATPQDFNAQQPAAPEAQVSAQSAPNDLVGQADAGAQEPQYSGKPIFMEFYDAPLSLVLKSFSDETGNNFVFPNDVGQIAVTVHFKGVPWDEALKAILETHALGLVRIGQNVVRVDQIANLTSYMASLEQAKQLETRRLTTKVLIFRLNNAVAKDIVARLGGLLARDVELDPRIKISEDERTNSIVMEAPPHVLAKAKNVIERLDLETPQVEIASRIVEVQKSMSNFLGFSWGNNLNFDPGRALGFGTLNFPNSLGSSFAVDPGVSTAPSAGVGRFRFGSLNKFVDLDLLLKLEEKKGTTSVLQSNRVLVLDGMKAKVLAGSSQFFRPAGGGLSIPTAGGGAAPTVGGSEGLAEVKFNLSLEVTPQVTAMGSVIMDLEIKSDTPNASGGEKLADKNTRELKTQMQRTSGDTGVIGGIYDTKHQTIESGIPFLSSIPIIGALFRSTSVTDAQTELLIMVTPTIVSGQSKESAMAEEDEAISREANKQSLAPKSGKKRDSSIF